MNEEEEEIPYPLYVHCSDWADDGNDQGPIVYK